MAALDGRSSIIPAPTARATRDRTPSAPTTNRARMFRMRPSASRAVTPTTRPVSSRSTSVTVTPLSKRAPASTAAFTRMVSSTWRRGAMRWSTPGALLDLLAQRRSSTDLEGHAADRRGTRCDDLVEQAPAGQLHHAAAGDRVGGQRVAREGGPVHDQDVAALVGEQHGGGGAGAAGADHDDLGVDVGCVRHGAHHPGSAPKRLGEALERSWRSGLGRHPVDLHRVSKHRRGRTGIVCGGPTGCGRRPVVA